MKLETKRLTMRPIAINDKNAFFAYRSDEKTNQYQGWIPKSINDVETFIGKTAEVINEPHSWFQLVIVENESHTIVGDIGLHFFDNENKQVEIGCTLNQSFQHIGYATEALGCVLTYLFEELHKHRVIASIDPANTPSIQLVERIGFRKEAHFVQSLWMNGTWADDVIYALLEKDWNL